MIPAELTAGLNWSWTASFADYPASVYSLVYTLINAAGKISITAVASGDDYAISETAGDTAGHAAGVYSYQAVVSNGTDAFLVEEGTVKVRPSFAAAESFDTRSHAQIVLDALEAMIENKASRDQQSINIAGRQISSFSPRELFEWRDRYRAERRIEIRRERRKKGLPTGMIRKVSF